MKLSRSKKAVTAWASVALDDKKPRSCTYRPAGKDTIYEHIDLDNVFNEGGQSFSKPEVITSYCEGAVNVYRQDLTFTRFSPVECSEEQGLMQNAIKYDQVCTTWNCNCPNECTVAISTRGATGAASLNIAFMREMQPIVMQMAKQIQ